MSNGDKTDKLPHRTVCYTSNASGWSFIPSAIVQTPHDGKNPKMSALGFQDYDGTFKEGLLVMVEKSGCMSKRTFFQWCIHFVQNLPRGQGPGGMPAFLLVDGHSSRRSTEALLYLRANNVHAICLPSHTSIWGQVHSCVALI